MSGGGVIAIYLFDGTWKKDEIDDRDDSNVVRFRDAYESRQFYYTGVGTRFWFVGKILGALFGVGAKGRIKKAFRQLKRNYRNGDEVIDIIGFSRGAAMSLHLANRINEEMNGADIRFLGLLDVVGSFGIPGNNLNLGWDLTLPDNARKCYHAMALDERRDHFPLTRVEPPQGGLPTDGRLDEVWFRGVHSDIGGGNRNRGLTSIPLSWLLARAAANGLPIDSHKLKQHQERTNPDAAISKNLDIILDPMRPVGADDTVHPSVKPRDDHNNPPPGMKTSEI
jgi:uncharacterized protein (DUF2235 family)